MGSVSRLNLRMEQSSSSRKNNQRVANLVFSLSSSSSSSYFSFTSSLLFILIILHPLLLLRFILFFHVLLLFFLLLPLSSFSSPSTMVLSAPCSSPDSWSSSSFRLKASHSGTRRHLPLCLLTTTLDYLFRPAGSSVCPHIPLSVHKRK